MANCKMFLHNTSVTNSLKLQWKNDCYIFQPIYVGDEEVSSSNINPPQMESVNYTNLYICIQFILPLYEVKIISLISNCLKVSSLIDKRHTDWQLQYHSGLKEWLILVSCHWNISLFKRGTCQSKSEIQKAFYECIVNI